MSSLCPHYLFVQSPHLKHVHVQTLTLIFFVDSSSPVLDPSDLILTRGTLDAEDEEADSDTDDIDHKGERRKHRWA